MKDTFYFSHDYNAQQDGKIQKLLAMRGWEGYGLFWALIESLYQNDGYLDLDCDRIAFIMRTQSEIIQDVISNYDLFEIEEGKFTSRSVLRRLSDRKSKSQKARLSANRRWKQPHANALRTHCERNAIKESKVKESKVNNISSKEDNKSTDPRPDRRDPRLDELMTSFKTLFGLSDFKESQQWQRIYAKHLVSLTEKLGKAEFMRRVYVFAADSFKMKNCNSLKYLYEQLKSTPNDATARIKSGGIPSFRAA